MSLQRKTIFRHCHKIEVAQWNNIRKAYKPFQREASSAVPGEASDRLGFYTEK